MHADKIVVVILLVIVSLLTIFYLSWHFSQQG